MAEASGSNADSNFKDFEEMLGSAKTLKRNDRKSSGILIGPSMASFLRGSENSFIMVFWSTRHGKEVGFGPKFRGTDGKPMAWTLRRKRNSA